MGRNNKRPENKKKGGVRPMSSKGKITEAKGGAHGAKELL